VRQTSFRQKIIGLIAVSLGVAQAATLAAILITTHRNVRENIEADLRVAEGVFESIFNARFVQLSESVRVLATDFGFKQAVATGDAPTILSAVENHSARAGADLAIMIDLSGNIIATTGSSTLSSEPAWKALVEDVMREDYLARTIDINRSAYQLVAVPVLAPDRIAWLFMGFAVNNELAAKFHDIAGLDVSFFSQAPLRLLASSLRPALQPTLSDAMASVDTAVEGAIGAVTNADHEYLTRLRPLGPEDSALLAVLQKSLSEELAPYDELALQLGGLSALILFIATVAGVGVARGITKPVQALAAAAERIGEGSYDVEIDVDSDDELGQLARTLGTMQFEIAERQHRIVHQAHHDDLTGLPNRWLANDRLKGAIHRAKRAGNSFSVVMLDLQRFKQINDSLGHHVGDVALKEIARRIVTRARRSDTVARLGGDDFLLILEASDLESSIRFVDSLKSVLTEPIELDDMRVALDFSVGIATYPEHAQSPDELIRRSEIAMYDAKAAHSRMVVYEPGRDEGHLRQLAIVSQLPAALADNQLSLHYQPKADIRTGDVCQAEALIRWIHPDFGFIPPDEFITVIEQSGNISLLTNWVIDTAARQCREWLDRRLDIKVSINLSALDLLNEDLPQTLERTLRKYGLAARQFLLEITESAVMRDPASALSLLTRLRRSGFTLSIDDFGTGYSSLAQLKRLPVDELKIDKSFVLELALDSDDAVIVKSTIELAHSMGLTVVAEGIETQAGWAALKHFGCEVGQGYLISKPLNAADFEDWMRGISFNGGRFLVDAA